MSRFGHEGVAYRPESTSVRVQTRSVSGQDNLGRLETRQGLLGTEALDPWAVTNILDSRSAELRTS